MDEDTLLYEFKRLREQLSEVEQQQMRANSRIQQDLAVLIAIVTVSLLATFSLWQGAKWSLWTTLGMILVAGLYTTFAIKQRRRIEY